jgi:ferredoxin
MIARRVVLKFPHQLVDQPIICRLVKEYNLEFNILKAYVTPQEEGLLVLELKGDQADYNKGMKYLTRMGVKVQLLSKDIVWNTTRCTHCGACIVICPTQALTLEPESRRVRFYSEKCIACELCIPTCPPRAMEVHF